VDSMKALVATMNEEQYGAFKASYDAQGTAPIFGQYGTNGGPGGNTPPPPGGVSAADDEIAILEDTVAQHKLAGRSEEEIEKMPSFKKLATLRAAKAQG